MQILVLAGGSGTRFWPASRRRRPKQLLSLEGERTLLQATVDRLAPLAGPERVWVCTNRALGAEVARQLPDVPVEQILLEPAGRNTLPAIGWSVRSMPPAAREEVIAVLPADHRVGDPKAFRATLRAAAEAVAAGDHILALGVTPRWPETGYGYLELGEVLDAEAGLRRVRRFIEKPDPETAARFLKSGEYLWNAGIFLFRGTRLLERIAEHQPEIAAGLEEVAGNPEEIDTLYPALPALSIDYGLMEHLADLGTMPLDCEWSDLGSWTSLAEVLPKDGQGNAVRGEVLALDAADNLLYSEEGLVAVLGVSGLVVVRTGDSVLVIPKERSQEIRRLVAALEESDRTERL